MRVIDADALQELCNGRIQDTWNIGIAPVSWAAAYADFKDDIDSIPTLTPPNEWVSVEEKLPDEELKRFKELFPEENEVEVLVMIQGAYTATTLYWDGERFYDEARSYKVTHWMPLPAPPGKDNNVPTKAPNEPLTLEQLRASPHGKIKDSTLQSICDRANEIACRPPEGEPNA